ncbi:sulfur carrier protein ThiS [Pusillimonas sp. (ex Stolz et al. 2005)]|uniref:sulfur carrier protein ThiS n=1 Tax=Pusillimonas sp. (ex Stolz et al. 2005) TaxID=1979962 RepID=UPI00262D9561|nr:sulfur carrier protein ThiS [Pusillimonas sp. (ex Stolz et al. 2005)]
MNITLNGKPHALGHDRSVADLIRSLGFEGKRIAVERNGDIVPKSQHADTLLNSNDVVEIVVAVGGG